MKQNPAVYFEIPVTDMERATAFYRAVFGFNFEHENIHNNHMALLPFYKDSPGISGALALVEIYKPSRDGVLIYLATDDAQTTIHRAIQNGGKELFPRTKATGYGYVAEIEDSEGNRIGLSEPNK